jgi:hypothetical protein
MFWTSVRLQKQGKASVYVQPNSLFFSNRATDEVCDLCWAGSARRRELAPHREKGTYERTVSEPFFNMRGGIACKFNCKPRII